MSKITLGEAARASADYLLENTDVDTENIAVRKSLQYYEELVKHILDGGEVILQDKRGRQRTMPFLEVKRPGKEKLEMKFERREIKPEDWTKASVCEHVHTGERVGLQTYSYGEHFLCFIACKQCDAELLKKPIHQHPVWLNSVTADLEKAEENIKAAYELLQIIKANKERLPVGSATHLNRTSGVMRTWAEDLMRWHLPDLIPGKESK